MDKFQPPNIKASGRKAIGGGILTNNFKDLADGIGDIVVPESGWDFFMYSFTRRVS